VSFAWITQKLHRECLGQEVNDRAGAKATRGRERRIEFHSEIFILVDGILQFPN
jgi:hypothetical protein